MYLINPRVYTRKYIICSAVVYIYMDGSVEQFIQYYAEDIMADICIQISYMH
jgi:hypothetical protein